MYEYIKGKLTHIEATQAVVEAGGVGYQLLISLQTYSQIHTLEDVKLWVHFIVREDAHLLYGFSSQDEREIFRHLISVSGVGPNTARMILSGMTCGEVRNALLTGDAIRFKHIKGIGTKTAERMVVELKDKMAKMGLSGDSQAAAEASLQSSTNATEAASALQLLGFSKIPVEKALRKLLTENPNYSLEELIKHALKLL